jgi:hypothetical protein
MKKWITAAALMFGLVAVVAAETPVSAQEVTKSVTITRDSRLGGKQVTKGGYDLKFVEGKEGELVLLKGKVEVTKSTYKVIKLNRPAADNGVAYIANDDGSFVVKRIEFKGKSEALVLE